MAGRDEKKANLGNGGSKGRLQIFVAGFAVEGGDNVLADGFKAIRDLTEAMKHSGVLAPPRVKAALTAGTEMPRVGSAKGEDLQPEETDEPVNAPEETADGELEEARTDGNRAKRSYNFKTPTFLNDLDISKAKKDLKEFTAEKNPSTTTAKYLVIVYWLQKYMDVAEVTIDHVYTIFDVLGWKGDMPSNPSVTLRDLKSKSHMLTREAGAEGYKLNFKGEQEVEKMK